MIKLKSRCETGGLNLKQALDPNKTLTKQALARLTWDIAHLKWQQNDRLNIESLKRQYEMGGTPVREALNQLVATGLVQALPLRGFKVRPLSAASSQACFQSRLHLEQAVMQHHLKASDDDWEMQWVSAQHRLKKQWHQQQQQVNLFDWSGAFADFQLSYIVSTDLTWFNTLYFTLEGHIQRYAYYLLTQVERPLSLIEADYQYSFMLSSALQLADAKEVARIVTHYWQQRSGLVEGSLSGRPD